MMTTSLSPATCALNKRSREPLKALGGDLPLPPTSPPSTSRHPHTTVAFTYIFPAISSRAQSAVTSQLPDVKKRGGTVGTAGWITPKKAQMRREQRQRDSRLLADRLYFIKLKPINRGLFLLLLIILTTSVKPGK